MNPLLTYSPEDTDEPIAFHAEEVADPLPQPDLLRRWIQQTINRYGGHLLAIQYIFCSDEYLHQLNIEYLDHDTLTDIITFPYAEPPTVWGDLFISIDRVQDNARSMNLDFQQELHRVMIHGVLHLLGYRDKSEAEEAEMRRLEDLALAELYTD